jgi:hypothetical protein
MADPMTLELKLALLAVFAQVALTFYAVFRMGVVRLNAIKAHKIPLGDVALSSTNYPKEALKHGNNLDNQFQFPVLLYVVVLFAITLEAVSMAFSLACIGFVITRFAHRFVHVTRNDVRLRFTLFLLGVIILSLAWVILGLNVITKF